MGSVLDRDHYEGNFLDRIRDLETRIEALERAAHTGLFRNATTTMVIPGGLEAADKIMLTDEGGIAIKLTNNTGGASVKGRLVKADSTPTDDAVLLTGAADAEAIGVFYEDNVADGDEVWIVVAGIADVMLDTNTGTTAGNWVMTGAAGYADGTNAAPVAGSEIGQAIETVAAAGAGTHVLARCVLQFV